MSCGTRCLATSAFRRAFAIAHVLHGRGSPRRDHARLSNLLARQKGQPADVIARAWQTQLRLHNIWKRYDARGKRRTVTAIAVARELAGACWAVALM